MNAVNDDLQIRRWQKTQFQMMSSHAGGEDDVFGSVL